MAAISTPRRGWLVKLVRIIPVEYSAVIAIAPKTTRTSWPRNRPLRVFDVRSSWARSAGEACVALPQANRTDSPTATPTVARSVQKVERTLRILVHSERSAPAKSARGPFSGRAGERWRPGAGVALTTVAGCGASAVADAAADDGVARAARVVRVVGVDSMVCAD